MKNEIVRPCRHHVGQFCPPSLEGGCTPAGCIFEWSQGQEVAGKPRQSPPGTVASAAGNLVRQIGNVTLVAWHNRPPVYPLAWAIVALVIGFTLGLLVM